ncbi:hypothetical protein HPB50_006839 [Hyalomma asiaticum]|uniref:Uncharacterized protein n=1 Tax=Hyalomma asiaticum TaxID=266040 RepID=A0ACB7RKT3_HYAAI|nr:hypothetical protein HPB50_006839 [Hyalomma asiaticum]
MDEPSQQLEIVRDDSASTETQSVWRANLADETAVNEWLEAYSVQTNTSWIVWKFLRPEASKNKKAGPRNANCEARLDIKIKLVTYSTRKKDVYLRREVPLPAVIRIDARHSHSTESVDALQLLRGTRSTREAFLRYFSDGLTPVQARRLHETKLRMEEDGPTKLANRALNPASRTVYHWYSVWREACFGGSGKDPLLKLKEKKVPFNAAQGVLLRRCPCGKVLNSSTTSQASGWVERREVSVQCGLQEMPPLSLPPETFPSVALGASIEERTSSGQGGRLSQGFPVLLENGTNSGTGKTVGRRQQFRCTLCPYKTPRLDNLSSICGFVYTHL